MLLSAVKTSITKNLEQSYGVPDDDVLAEKVYEALLYVASQCEPQALLRKQYIEDVDVYRKLPDGFCIILPEHPDFGHPERALKIDETLSYAVINATCFLLSGDGKYDVLCSRWMHIFRKNDLNAYACEEIKEND